MSLSPEPALRFVGGRLALDFANMVPARGELSWDQLIAFLQSAHIITAERGGELLALSRNRRSPSYGKPRGLLPLCAWPSKLSSTGIA